jgi:RNA polymerase sigma factor (sigma-70 family)
MAAVPSIQPAPIPSRSADETSDLYARYHRQIFSFCLRELGNREEAEDATQSTFLNAFRALENGTLFEHESAWLYQAAHHVCQTRRRSWYRRHRVETDGDFDRIQHIVASPQSDDDELFGLRPALESMPEQQRKALLLREWQGLSYAEIATELELSQSAVETLLFRARRGLAERLTEEPAEAGKVRKIGRTGDFGSLGAAIKALFFSGGIKIAATLATVAATTVVASAPAVRNDVVHFVAPALPEAAATVKHPQHAKRHPVAHTLATRSSASSAVVTVTVAKPAVKRVVHHAVRTHTEHSTIAVASTPTPAPAAPAPTKVVKPRAVAAPATTTVSTTTTTTAAVTPPPAAPTPAPVVTPPTPAPDADTTTTTPAATTAPPTTTTQTTASTPPPPPPAPVAPPVTGFTPSSGLVGATVSIAGGPFTGVTSVKFNGVSASFGGSGSTILAKVPNGATSGPITVTTAAGTSSSAGSFTVTPPPAPVFTPAVAGFSPSSASAGAVVSIWGSHFTGTTSVTFNGVPSGFTVNSDSQLTTQVPQGATTGPVVVTTPQGSVTATTFTILVPPAVTSFSLTSAAPGASVTITGSHLSGATVRFNGVPASVLSGSDSTITAQVPSSATSGPISVSTSSGTVTTATFSVLVAPTLNGFSPSTGVTGTPVTVYGAHFTGATAVTLNGAAVQFSVGSDTQLTLTVPAGATSGAIAVTTPSGTVTSSSAFTVTAPPPPSIAGISPFVGRAGTSVTIAGAHFTGTTAVKFNGVTASFTVNSDSQLTAVEPSGATSGALTVTTATGTASTTFFVLH